MTLSLRRSAPGTDCARPHADAGEDTRASERGATEPIRLNRAARPLLTFRKGYPMLSNPLRGRRPIERLLALTVVVAILGACASVGSANPWEVRAEDLRVNSRVIWDRAMSVHEALGRSESPAVHKALEQLRVEFPKLHRAYVAALEGYQAARANDPALLRKHALEFLGALEQYGDEKWKESVRLLRLAWEGGRS